MDEKCHHYGSKSETAEWAENKFDQSAVKKGFGRKTPERHLDGDSEGKPSPKPSHGDRPRRCS